MRPGGSTLLPCEMRTMCGSDVPGGTRRRGTGQGRAGPLCCVPPSRGRTAQPARYRLMAVRRSRDGRDPFGLRLSRRALCSPTSRLCGQRVKSSEGWKEAAEFQQRRKKKKENKERWGRRKEWERGEARAARCPDHPSGCRRIIINPNRNPRPFSPIGLRQEAPPALGLSVPSPPPPPRPFLGQREEKGPRCPPPPALLRSPRTAVAARCLFQRSLLSPGSGSAPSSSSPFVLPPPPLRLSLSLNRFQGAACWRAALRRAQLSLPRR